MCLFAPGIPQLALKWWWRGILQCGGALVLFVLAASRIIGPMLRNYSLMLNDGSGQMEKIDLAGFFQFVFLLMLLWLWSFIDIIIFYKGDKDDTGENND
jgi:hypothetical protein